MSRSILFLGTLCTGGAAIIVACTVGRPTPGELTATTSESLTLTPQTNYWVEDGGNRS